MKRKLRHNELSCHFMVGDSPVTLGPVEFWLGSTGPLCENQRPDNTNSAFSYGWTEIEDESDSMIPKIKFQ